MTGIEYSHLLEFFDNSSMPFFFATIGGKRLFFNEAFCRLVGFSKEELYTMDRTRMIPEDTLAQVKEKQDRVIMTGKPQIVEKEYIRKDGTAVPVEVHLHVGRIGEEDGLGGEDLYYAFVVDKTESRELEKRQREAVEARRVSEENLSRAFRYLPKMACITTMDGKFLDVTDTFSEFLGCKKEDIIGKSVPDLGWAETKGRQTFFKEIEEKGFVTEMEFTFQTKPRGETTVLISGVKVQTGDTEYLISSMIDITERKRAEEALQESEERYRVLFMQSRDAMLTFDVGSWRMVAANPAVLKMFGIEDLEGFLKLDPEDISPERQPDGRFSTEKAKEMIETALRGGALHFEWMHRRVGGGEFPCIVLLSRIDLGGKVFVQSTIRDISDLKRAEEALRESEERYRSFISSASDLVFVKDRDYRYVIANSRLAEFFDRPVEEIIGKTDFELMPDYAAEQTRYSDVAARELSSVVISEEPIYGRIYETHKFPIRLGDDQMGIGGFIRDITERKEAENSLRASESKYRSLVEHMLEGMLIIDLSGNVLMANPSVIKLVGLDPSEELDVTSYNVKDFLNPLFHAKVAEGIKEITEGNESTREFPITLPDGTMIWIEAHGSIIEFQGKGAGLILLRDISERKRAEQELKEAQQRLANIINFLPDATLVIDLEGRVISWNRAAEEMTGIPAKDMIGERDYEYAIPFYGCRRPMMIDLVLDPEKEPETGYTGIERKGLTIIGESYCPAMGKDGAFVRATASPLCDSHGNIVGAIESIRDATEQKKAEEQMKYLSLHDSLTGLYNRTYFEEEMLRLNSGRFNPVGIIICDVDGLKLVNDTFGHETGDILLVEAANVIRKGFQEGEVIARVGGDEFTVLIPKASQEALECIIRRIRSNIEKYNNENPDLPLSISVGFAVTTEEGTSVYDMFRQADNNMYREKLRRKQSTRSAIVQTLMKALETRDFITKGHAERLQSLAVALANQIGLPENRINDLILLAQFHDIGKVGVSDSILFKKGPLTPEERKEMQRHCEMGYHIALAAPDLAPIADWILKHQEWWNGKGYPLGIKGEDIPLECRILAIVDAYDAMVSDRPYRKAMPRQEALEELVRCRGTQFDPRLVDLFIKALGG